MIDSLQQFADTNLIIDSMIQHQMDSILAAVPVSEMSVYQESNEKIISSILAISTVVLLIGSAIGYQIFNARYWERGIFPPILLNRRINHFEALICLAVNIIRCDKDSYAEKQAMLLSFMRKKFPDIKGGVVHSMKLALGRPLTTISIANWLNKHIKQPRERLEILDFLFTLSTLDGDVGQSEYTVLREYSLVMGMNQQQLDDRITAFKRLRAEQLHNEQQRAREYRQATTSSVDHLQQKALTVLGLTMESSPEEIKKAYRTLVKQFHPDRFQHATRAEQKQMELQFIRIQEAYEYLTQ